ncbi:MAG: AAA family ATPase [Halioglobus sp.]
MSNSFYELTAEPFANSSERRFLFSHSGYAKARLYLESELMRSEGIVVLSGFLGIGKATLMDQILAQYPLRNLNVGRLICAQNEADAFLFRVASCFGIESQLADEAAALAAIEEYCQAQCADGNNVLLVVEEAQNLGMRGLQALRLLTDLKKTAGLRLQLFLLGQPELRELIRGPEMDQLRATILSSSELRPLSLQVTQQYIEHRLRAAGWSDNPEIDAAVFSSVQEITLGIPERINILCGRLLRNGEAQQKRSLNEGDVALALEQLGSEPASRAILADSLDLPVVARSGGRQSDTDTVVPDTAPTSAARPGAAVVEKKMVEPAARNEAATPVVSPEEPLNIVPEKRDRDVSAAVGSREPREGLSNGQRFLFVVVVLILIAVAGRYFGVPLATQKSISMTPRENPALVGREADVRETSKLEDLQSDELPSSGSDDTAAIEKSLALEADPAGSEEINVEYDGKVTAVEEDIAAERSLDVSLVEVAPVDEVESRIETELTTLAEQAEEPEASEEIQLKENSELVEEAKLSVEVAPPVVEPVAGTEEPAAQLADNTESPVQSEDSPALYLMDRGVSRENGRRVITELLEDALKGQLGQVSRRGDGSLEIQPEGVKTYTGTPDFYEVGESVERIGYILRNFYGVGVEVISRQGVIGNAGQAALERERLVEMVSSSLVASGVDANRIRYTDGGPPMTPGNGESVASPQLYLRIKPL